ncbi:hypothetical protein [Microbacterium sp. H1-D42]|uniref:hypothetical protein n=1 Tax=Microbacterium sp. H1-D42 TaxID=2925844 RepID=UPI001F52D934|nr:hypothetical protein [Microbacterium sp. H1-D42]UNK71206.1 hypothetical protein MNR00_01780 [Microbacterium sp. H1-D42]
MKGKIGLVVGLGVGYVLGTRAGRERYEQIKTQWLKVWHLDPVQAQVTRVQDFAKSQAAAIPGALWNGAVKVAKAVSDSGTPGEKLDNAVDAAKDAAGDVADAAEDAAEAVQKRAEANSAAKRASKRTSTKSTAKPATKSTTKKNGS